MDKDSFGDATKAVHSGQDPDAATGAVNVPVYLTSTFEQDAVGSPRQFNGRELEYSRVTNPTRDALEDSLAALENADFARAFASGLAAESSLIHQLLQPGDHILMGNDAYGGTYRLIAQGWDKWGVGYSAVDFGDLDLVERSMTDATKFVWFETPTNPNLSVYDIAAISEIAHKHGALSIVDNTFASPYLQKPLDLGADVVVHSATKYIGGHSDVVGGCIATNIPEIDAKLGWAQKAIGAVLGPMDCYLLLRGIKTLPIRMEAHSKNAQAVAEYLLEHPSVETVFYPGLTNHPGHDLATKQMNGLYGGMVSFIVAGGADQARKVVEATELFILAESLGGVESLIEVPAGMTHLSAAGSEFEVDPALVRLSVGIEDARDLIADLSQALSK